MGMTLQVVLVLGAGGAPGGAAVTSFSMDSAMKEGLVPTPFLEDLGPEAVDISIPAGRRMLEIRES